MKKLLIMLSLLCSFSLIQAQTMQDGHYNNSGTIKSDGTIQDSHYSTIGYIKSDGTVQDSHYSTIGYIKSDGTVQDSHYSTIGHASGIKKEWAAAYYFFFKMN